MQQQCEARVATEDFDQLNIKAGDKLYYRPLDPRQPVPEGRAVVVRNVYTDRVTVGYVAGETLHLARHTIRRYHDWGAEVVGVVAVLHWGD